MLADIIIQIKDSYYQIEIQTSQYPNDYEIWWKGEKLATIEVAELQVWELDDIFEKKLYNLLPIVIFGYRKGMKEGMEEAKLKTHSTT
ncbi:hypothetical protein [Candidatus Epulonipiscium viviparus]|uniref:hypothetical protein n=1 Tax=Candidatus Epulonipiscium viviparus TaxID=420336 RepID=UPI0027380663|nr:hypothetical protein [Candidatus Epulopiscium viviparus]